MCEASSLILRTDAMTRNSRAVVRIVRKTRPQIKRRITQSMQQRLNAATGIKLIQTRMILMGYVRWGKQKEGLGGWGGGTTAYVNLEAQ